MNLAGKIKAKATKYLGEDGMDNLKDLKKDLLGAGTQIRTVAKEVWDDCRDDVVSAGGQISDFSREVREDCDNDVLRNAREFYGGMFEKAQNGELKQNIIATGEQIRNKKEEMARVRRRNMARRQKTIRKAIIVIVCMIIAALLIISVVLHASKEAEKATLQSDGSSTPIPAASGELLHQAILPSASAEGFFCGRKGLPPPCRRMLIPSEADRFLCDSSVTFCVL
jgi:hypothetical protein